MRGFSHKLGKGPRSWLAPVPPARPQIPTSTGCRFLHQVDSGWRLPPQGEGPTLPLLQGVAEPPALPWFSLSCGMDISHLSHTSLPLHPIGQACGHRGEG